MPGEEKMVKLHVDDERTARFHCKQRRLILQLGDHEVYRTKVKNRSLNPIWQGKSWWSYSSDKMGREACDAPSSPRQVRHVRLCVCSYPR